VKKIALSFIFILFTLCLAANESPYVIIPEQSLKARRGHKEIAKQFYEAFAKNDWEKMESLLARNYGVQDSNVIFDSSYSKYDAFSKNLNVRARALHSALPDFKLQIIEMVEEEDKVLVRLQIQGIQRGSFLGVEATDKPIVIKVFTILTIEEGKITHLNEIWNELGVMKQMGYLVL